MSASAWSYYPGCYALGSARELDLSTRAACERLGIELRLLSRAPCCGAGDLQHTDGARALALNALVLADAAAAGLDVMTVCNVCTLSLRQADAELHGARPAPPPDCQGPYAGAVGMPRRRRPPLPAEQAGTARPALADAGVSFPVDGGGPAVTHLLWVLRDLAVSGKLTERVRRRCRLTVAPFYGCQILRPGELNPEDDTDDPVALEQILAACGATPVDHPARLSCCGWPIAYARERTAGALARAAVESARAAGADAIVTPCPLCQSSLERAQSGPGAGSRRVPVLHLPQLVGLALGAAPCDLGLARHAVPAGAVLARLGLTPDSSAI